MKNGDLLVLTYGRDEWGGALSDGEQIASVVHDFGPIVRVRKWRAALNLWTAPVLVPDADIVRFATVDDVNRFQPALDAQGAPV